MKTTPVPKIAFPIINMIRMMTEKPKGTLSSLWENGKNHLRFENGVREMCCPLGALPCSRFSAPADAKEAGLPMKYNRGVKAFARWWDKQEDAKAAVARVWGK